METLAFVRRCGPLWVKKLIWNLDFRRVRWDKCRPCEKLVGLLLQVLRPDSSLLDLGCANGALVAHLRGQGWNGPYTGVDVSSEALRSASQQGLASCQWIVSDMCDFATSSHYDVIVASESLYYLRIEEATRLLQRLPGFLTSCGIIVIRIHDCEQYKDYVAAIETIYPTARKLIVGEGIGFFILQTNDPAASASRK